MVPSPGSLHIYRPIVRRRVVAMPSLRMTVVAASLLALAAATFLGMSGCHSDSGTMVIPRPPSPPYPTPPAGPTSPTLPARVGGPNVMEVRSEPEVRVRIVTAADRVTIDAPGHSLVIGPTAAQAQQASAHAYPSPVTVWRVPGGAFGIRTAQGQAVSWALSAIQVRAAGGGNVTVNGTAYPQALILYPVTQAMAGGGSSDRIDVVNHVMLESYLPGVLQKELYTHWHPWAFEAQAIAARSYAVCQRQQWRQRHFDMESTTASQAYVGASASSKARQAVQQTRGVALTYNDHVLPAYYSSCCGGTSQDAHVAFPLGENIGPLHARARAAWCQNAKLFRWGPIQRDRRDLSRRMALWGATMKHPLAGMSEIADIRISRFNDAGRPSEFTVTDIAGRRYTLGPEEFRFACNADGGALSALPASMELRSSHVEPSVRGDVVLFVNGRGHGHGVGLCQWGAQGMVTAGIDPRTVLSYYYPGTSLRTLY